ncbi:MAG TPA: hypothetical protein VK674_02245 [Candidatus Limnocylindria bacterium]|nr:hypothetical protein [Candidatus Limnocylindria bacterium]
MAFTLQNALHVRLDRPDPSLEPAGSRPVLLQAKFSTTIHTLRV